MKENSTLETIKNRLKGYSALAGAVVATGSASGDILYNDSNVLLNSHGENFDIDLNHDSINDIKITFERNGVSGTSQGYNTFNFLNRGKIDILGSISVVSSSFGGVGTFAGQFSDGDYVSTIVPAAAGNGWSNGLTKLGSYRSKSTYDTGSSTMTQSFKPYGAWGSGTGSIKKYIGLRIPDGAGTGHYYGWAQIRIAARDTTIRLVGYAMNDVLDEKIMCGRVSDFADSASAIMVSDGADALGPDQGADLTVDFMLADTAKTGEVRAIAVEAGGDTLEYCDERLWALPDSMWATTSLSDTNASGGYTVNFAGKTDIEGNTIVNGKTYKVYIYTRGMGSNSSVSNRSVLLKSSNSILLLGQAEPVTALSASDISDLDNAGDLEVVFNEPTDVSKQDTYNIFVVKDAKAATFDCDSADAVLPANMKAVASTGSAGLHTINFAAGDKDTDGDDIVVCENYTIFVKSMANNVTADRDTMVSSSSVILKGTVDSVQAVTYKDVDDTQTGSDLEFSFKPPADLASIVEYRVYAVPNSLLPFDVTKALAVTDLDDYVTVYEDGSSDYTFNFADKNDAAGGVIQNDKNYTICVLTLADGVCDDKHILNCNDDPVKLVTIIPAKVDGSTICPTDTADNRDGRDMHVQFTGIADEDAISGYRLLVITTDLNTIAPLSVGLADDMVRLGYSKYVPKAGNGTEYNVTLDRGSMAMNAYGGADPIRNYVSYNVYIMAMGDQVKSFTNSLSDSSKSVVLRDYYDLAENILEGNVTVTSFENNVRVLLDPSIKPEGTVMIYNSLGQVVKSADIDNREVLINNVSTENGVYFVSVLVGDAKLTEKVLISSK